MVKVNPETGEIDEDPSKNTKVQFWLETGPYDSSIAETAPRIFSRFTHDPDLDSAGDTFEDAIIELAERVRAKYTQPSLAYSDRPAVTRRIILSGDEASLTGSTQT